MSRSARGKDGFSNEDEDEGAGQGDNMKSKQADIQTVNKSVLHRSGWGQLVSNGFSGATSLCYDMRYAVGGMHRIRIFQFPNSNLWGRESSIADVLGGLKRVTRTNT